MNRLSQIAIHTRHLMNRFKLLIGLPLVPHINAIDRFLPTHLLNLTYDRNLNANWIDSNLPPPFLPAEADDELTCGAAAAAAVAGAV